MEMIYVSDNGAITQRLITPYSFDGKMITGYCAVRKQIRTFQLTNILSAQYRFLSS
jgi:predicted DNA-binding transcriptional regulator YafY